MNELEFEQFLHEQIPITKAMGFSIIEFTKDRVRVSAKLDPNVNHKGTAFGGSINSLLTVCGWAMVYVNIKEIDPDAHIVIHKSSINYAAPIDTDFIAECTLPEDESKEKFFNMYSKHGKSRLMLTVTCYDGQKLLAEYNGQYVAFK